jgi:hypothetical protein
MRSCAWHHSSAVCMQLPAVCGPAPLHPSTPPKHQQQTVRTQLSAQPAAPMINTSQNPIGWLPAAVKPMPPSNILYHNLIVI